MPIPNTGPLSFSTIQAEFGGTNPISLSEYYAGGGRVPAGTSGVNGAVPSSGAISVSRFLGTSALQPFVVVVNPTSVNGFTSTIGGPPAGFVESSDATASASGGQAPYTFNGWTRLAGSSTNIIASSPSTATSTFRGTIFVGGESATFRARFTDNLGTQATADVFVTLTYDNGV